jgi:hypothetical protein
VLRTPPPISANTLLFGPETAPEAVACWLMRFFGPQIAAADAGFMQVSISGKLAPVRMIADMVVRTGQNVRLIGDTTTLIVSKHQLRVQTGATLDLQRITIAESYAASALVIAGRVSMKNCTIRNCVAQANSVNGNGLQSRGGGMYVKSGGAAEVVSCRLVGNTVRDPNSVSEGGAIFASPKSSVKLVGSVLDLNVASASKFPGYEARGGALMADKAFVEVEDTQFLRNTGFSCGAICVIGPGATLNVTGSKLASNSAVNEAGMAIGGALCLSNSVSAEIVSSALTDNVARSLSEYKTEARGGALFVLGDHRINITNCTLARNVAETPIDNGVAYGGALFATGATS